ncbi:tripartite tricarboxylate transporter TctB family protein [Salinisphaera aquimarina]|uniref:Tripartite tricarboxylate transporter TctB family protein n=1 Tax=Salinisphaera aquimarina TaxID=2094031 RepID=A0ABV7EN83_9GAMM
MALFGITLFVLIPAYVPRPAFIPGFAPPPDMWPRTVSIIGLILGLIAIAQTFSRRGIAMAASDDEPIWQEAAPMPVLLGRFALIIAALAAFVAFAHALGFLVATILLTGACILLTGERGYHLWRVVVAVLLPAALLFFFSHALGTQFPHGSLLKSFGL